MRKKNGRKEKKEEKVGKKGRRKKDIGKKGRKGVYFTVKSKKPRILRLMNF